MKSIVVVLFLSWSTIILAQDDAATILQKIDTLDFNKKELSLKKENVYHSMQYERQKFYAFKKRMSKIKDEKKYLNEIHSFAKDSLQILAVKLISVKELNTKKLLDKDIAQNTDFYVSLLDDLKESDINSHEYLFLENKLSKFLIAEVETKYTYSKWLNIILVGLLIGGITYSFYKKSKKEIVIELSKQETTIKNLILKGKTNKEIAEELFISLSTVKTHITNIYQKLNISNRDELTSKFKNTTSTST